MQIFNLTSLLNEELYELASKSHNFQKVSLHHVNKATGKVRHFLASCKRGGKVQLPAANQL